MKNITKADKDRISEIMGGEVFASPLDEYIAGCVRLNELEIPEEWGILADYLDIVADEAAVGFATHDEFTKYVRAELDKRTSGVEEIV